MENLEIYNKVREVPKEAQKEITGGKLKGKTDINPMWRIKKLTETFGICGFGWKTKIIDKRLEAGANGEVAAFVDIELYVKVDGEWSDPIIGTGGSMLVNTEKSALATNDEAFKMAYTDAISVACKALGFGADIYWQQDRTKYDEESEAKKEPIKCSKCGKVVEGREINGAFRTPEEIIKQCDGMCIDCYIKSQPPKIEEKEV